MLSNLVIVMKLYKTKQVIAIMQTSINLLTKVKRNNNNPIGVIMLMLHNGGDLIMMLTKIKQVVLVTRHMHPSGIMEQNLTKSNVVIVTKLMLIKEDFLSMKIM